VNHPTGFPLPFLGRGRPPLRSPLHHLKTRGCGAAGRYDHCNEFLGRFTAGERELGCPGDRLGGELQGIFLIFQAGFDTSVRERLNHSVDKSRSTPAQSRDGIDFVIVDLDSNADRTENCTNFFPIFARRSGAGGQSGSSAADGTRRICHDPHHAGRCYRLDVLDANARGQRNKQLVFNAAADFAQNGQNHLRFNPKENGIDRGGEMAIVVSNRDAELVLQGASRFHVRFADNNLLRRTKFFQDQAANNRAGELTSPNKAKLITRFAHL